MARIQPDDVMHPEDRAALDNLRSIPLLPSATKAFMKAAPEDMLAGLNMVQKIRLGPSQLPHVYGLLPPLCDALGIPEPEFYLEMNPFPNAYTYGDTRVFITVTSGLLQCMSEEEVRVVVAHECGHVFARHVLYHTMADLLLKGAIETLGIPPLLLAPIQAPLFYWYRRSELTADRVAALLAGGAKPVVEMLIRLSGGPRDITEQVDTEAFVAQADAFHAHTNSKWADLLQNAAVISAEHPWPALRAAAVTQWSASESFRRLRADLDAPRPALCIHCEGKTAPGWKFCRHCGKPIGSM